MIPLNIPLFKDMFQYVHDSELSNNKNELASGKEFIFRLIKSGSTLEVV